MMGVNRKVGRNTEKIAIDDAVFYSKYLYCRNEYCCGYGYYPTKYHDSGLMGEGLFHELDRSEPENNFEKESSCILEENERMRLAAMYPATEDHFGLPMEFEYEIKYKTVIYARRRESTIVWDAFIMHWGAYPEKIRNEYEEVDYIYPQDNFIAFAGTVEDVIIKGYEVLVEPYINSVKLGYTREQWKVEEYKVRIAELEQAKLLKRVAWDLQLP